MIIITNNIIINNNDNNNNNSNNNNNNNNNNDNNNNNRIGTKLDFLVEDREDLDFLPEGYELDTFTTHGNNEDVSLNNYGEQLIQLLIASKLKVLNSIKRGDLQRHFVYLGYQVCRAMDLDFLSENTFQTNLRQ